MPKQHFRDVSRPVEFLIVSSVNLFVRAFVFDLIYINYFCPSVISHKDICKRRRSQGGAVVSPRCKKYIFNKKCVKFRYFSAQNHARGGGGGGLQQPFGGSEVTPRKTAPSNTNSWISMCLQGVNWQYASDQWTLLYCRRRSSERRITARRRLSSISRLAADRG